MFVDSTRKLDHIDNNRNDAQHLAKLIRFHCVAKGWFSDTSELYSLYILVQLICSMIFLASAIFQLDLVIFDYFPPNLAQSLASVTISCDLVSILAQNSSIRVTLTIGWVCWWCLFWLVARISSDFAISGRWQLRAIQKCPIYCTEPIGRLCRFICRNISFWWLATHKFQCSTMGLVSPFWIWTHFPR